MLRYFDLYVAPKFLCWIFSRCASLLVNLVCPDQGSFAKSARNSAYSLSF